MSENILTLDQLLTDDTTVAQFMAISETAVTEQSKRILGDNATRILGTAILCAAVFGPDPFSIEAFRAICAVDEAGQPLPEAAADEIVDRSKRLGLFAELSAGRVKVSSEQLSARLGRLLIEHETQPEKQ